MRAPDVIINNGDPADPYLYRWWIIPRNKWFNIYLHKMMRDDQPDMHDHPWLNVSIILKGGFIEQVPDKRFARTPFTRVTDLPRVGRRRRPGAIIFRRATAVHRLVFPANNHPGYCWTLFLTGPWLRVWGFHCKHGWRPWTDYLKPPLPGQPTSGDIGNGCD